MFEMLNNVFFFAMLMPMLNRSPESSHPLPGYFFTCFTYFYAIKHNFKYKKTSKNNFFFTNLKNYMERVHRNYFT